MELELAAAIFEGLRWGAVGSAFTLGLRHGWDWDHVAAITDITSSQTDDRRALLFSTLYIVGHALVVAAFGVAAIVAGATIPAWLDALMGRVVGATLVALGVYVLVSLVRNGRDARMRSRWMLAFDGARRLTRWVRARYAGDPVVVEHDHDHAVDHPHHDDPDTVAEPGPETVTGGDAAVAGRAEDGSEAALAVTGRTHRHPHRHVGSLPDDPFTEYGTGTSLAVGMLHGVGAETPTQMLLFASAAGAGTAWVGTTFLVAFLVGLMLSNTAVAVASRFGFLNAERNFAAYATVTVLVAVLSLYLGTVFLLAAGEGLPGIFT